MWIQIIGRLAAFVLILALVWLAPVFIKRKPSPISLIVGILVALVWLLLTTPLPP